MAGSNAALLGVTLSAAVLLTGCAGIGERPAQTSATVEFGSTQPAQDTADRPTSAPSSTVPAVGGIQVEINDFAFAPANLTVPVGTTVVWTNHDAEPHTVVARSGGFRSPALDTNATFAFTFVTPGTYDYVCSIHPMMTATVVVTK